MRDSTHLSERAVRQAIEWAAAEGWTPGVDDGERFLAADPEAFAATELDGEIAGTVSCALYGDAYASLGFELGFADDDRIRGYAVLRRCGEGAKIGPLLADDPVVAAELLVGMRAAAGEGTTIFLDVPHANPAALEIAAASLDAPVFETARMYRNGRPPEDIERVFGVTTFELG